MFVSCSKLTSRQRSLLLSYAEEETDVQGTVAGVSPSPGEKSFRENAAPPRSQDTQSHRSPEPAPWFPAGGSSAPGSGSEEGRDKRQEPKEEGGFFSKLKKMFS